MNSHIFGFEALKAAWAEWLKGSVVCCAMRLHSIAADVAMMMTMMMAMASKTALDAKVAGLRLRST